MTIPGGVYGTASYASQAYSSLSSSYALTSSISITNLFTQSIVSSSYASASTQASFATQSISSSFSITSSWSQTTISASYALTASYALNESPVASSSYASTASWAQNIPTVISTSFSSASISSSFAQSSATSGQSNSATQSLYATQSNFATSSISSSFATTASWSVTASYALNGNGASLITGSSYSITSSWAYNSLSSSYSSTASIVIGLIPSSSYSLTSSYSLNGGGATLITGATYQITSSWSNYALTASFALVSSSLIQVYLNPDDGLYYGLGVNGASGSEYITINELSYNSQSGLFSNVSTSYAFQSVSCSYASVFATNVFNLQTGSGTYTAEVYNTTVQSIPNSVYTPISFSSEAWVDPIFVHSTSTNNSRIYITNTGKYVAIGNFQFYSNSTTGRGGAFRVNGTSILGVIFNNNDTSEPTTRVCTELLNLTSGSYVELVAWQGSGGSLNVAGDGTNTSGRDASCRFSLTYLSMFSPTQSYYQYYQLSSSYASSSLSSSYALSASYSPQVTTVPSASWASSSISSSYALTASYSLNGGSGGTSLTTGSTYPITSSWSNNSLTASYFSGSISNAISAISSSYALTASFKPNYSCQAYNSISQSMPLTTFTAVNYDTNVWDDLGFHNTASNNSRFIAPYAGRYRITANIQWYNGTSATSVRYIAFSVNGITQRFGMSFLMPGNASVGDGMCSSAILSLNASDYVQVILYQSDSTILSISNDAGAASGGTPNGLSRCTFELIG